MRKVTLLALCLAIGCNFATAKEKNKKKPNSNKAAQPAKLVDAVPPPLPEPQPVPPPNGGPQPVPPPVNAQQAIPQPVLDANAPVDAGTLQNGARVPGERMHRRPIGRQGMPNGPQSGPQRNLPPGARMVPPPMPQQPPLPGVPPPMPQAQEPVKINPNAGVFSFPDDTHNFGLIPEGNPVEWDFEFKNDGKEAIVIKEAHGSCGCTIPTYPKEPIAPGKGGKIHVVYNTKGRPGVFNKEVIITSNARQQPMVLHIGGEVKTQ